MPLSGLLQLLGAALGFSAMSALVKLLGETLPSPMMVLARALVTFAISLAMVRHAGVSPWGVDRPRLLLRAGLGFIGLVCFFFAVTRLPLAEVTVIHYLNPLIAAGLAAVFLKERISLSLVAAVGLSFAGMLLVTRPSALTALLGSGGPTLDPWGVAAAFGGATAGASAYVTVRRLRHTDHPLVIVLWFAAFAVPACLPLVVPVFVMPQGREWLLLLGVGVATQISQVLLTRGLAAVPAGPATAVGYVQILFAAGIGALFFDEGIGALTAAGALLVVTGTLLAAWPRRR